MAQIFPANPQSLNRQAALRQMHDNQMLMHGIIGGVAGGIVFAIGDSLLFLLRGQSFWDPLRLTGSMELGHRAMDPSYPLLHAAGIGVLVWLFFSAFYGVLFVYLASLLGLLNSTRSRLVLAGVVWGAATWLINIFLITPLAFPWFSQYSNLFWNGLVAHGLFYGATLGAYIGSAWPWVHDQIHRRLPPRMVA